ncbi:hypothetical protein PybrP1_009932, partial [[Pythium] brassicae (nom. inval.)]
MKLLHCMVFAALGVCGASAFQVDWDAVNSGYDVGTVHSVGNVKQSDPTTRTPTLKPATHTKSPKAATVHTKASNPTTSRTPSPTGAPRKAPTPMTKSPTMAPEPVPTSDDVASDVVGEDSDNTNATNSTASGRFLQPFKTNAPSEKLFKRNANLGKLAPVANLPQSIIKKQRPIPTNKWWGNLIHTTEKDRLTLADPAWSNPYAVKLPVKEAPFGLQACYSYSYREKAGVVDDKIKFYRHVYHNDVTLSAQDGAVTFKADGKSIIGSGAYTGSLRVAVLPDKASANVYDAYASCTVLGGQLSAYQKYASLCLLADDPSVVGTDTSLKTTCLTKLETLIEPFLTNGWTTPLVYETTYRGIVTGQVFTANDVNVDFGNGVYNDHHYHYGYWIAASAMLKKLDPKWSRMPELEEMVWSLLRDVANPSAEDPYFPKFRHFSWFLGHSFSHGVTPLADGKDQESTSEDINFLYGMMLWGQVTGKKAVEDLGSLMLRVDARAIRTYFLMDSRNTVHPPEFARNHVTGIFFDNKVDYTTWFSAEKYCIHGIQMIPVSPINEIVRSRQFVQEEWDDVLSKEAVVKDASATIAWLSLLYVNYAT